MFGREVETQPIIPRGRAIIMVVIGMAAVVMSGCAMRRIGASGQAKSAIWDPVRQFVAHVPAARAWLSKKGYDYYQAQSLTLLATCDSSGGSAAKGGKPVTATYDLVMGKKA